MNDTNASSSALLATYSKYPITLVKGEGSWVWDSNGKKYLDFYGGHAVCLLGHCPESVVKAIKEQSEKLMFYSNVVETEPAHQLADKLAATLDEPYQIYFTNSGSEANETAIKMARKHTGKKQIISFTDSFHGRSMTSLAVTGIDSYHQFEPNFDAFTSFAEFGDMESVKQAYNDDIAAVILEPIQSIGGINMAEPTFYSELATFCKEKGMLLIFDEVQTGLGRTGSFWFCQSVSVTPDIITTAKGIASGLPLAVVLVHESVSSNIKLGDHATTFGGGPVVCVAGLATVTEILENDLEVSKKEAYLKEKLEAHPSIKQLRGKGLLLGIEFDQDMPDLPKKALEIGLFIASSKQKNVIRLMPPLNVTWQEIDSFIELFFKLLP